MNDRFQNATLDDGRFDRLVDGELSPAEYQAFLSALDDEPGSWRRCALAFLEAQAWRSEMGAIRSGQELVPARPPASKAKRLVTWKWGPQLAVAASCVLAFLGGLVVQRQWDIRSANNRVARDGNPSRDLMLAQDDVPGTAGPQELGQETGPLGNIRLVVDGGQGNQAQQIDVPVYDLDRVGPEWFSHDRPVLPEDVIELLKRRGRKVERQVEYLPLPIDDERHVVVPVEQIQITPVSRRSY